MSDVLSQSEIDELLSAFNSGNLETAVKPDAPEERIRNFDFRTANRFSREQIRTLSIIYETFARLLETHLSGTLRTICKVDLLSVEEQKYQEFINAMPQPVMLAITSMAPLTGSTLVEMGPTIVYSIISRLLGGAGDIDSRQVGANRPYTEIELVLIERVLRQVMNLISESWERVIPVTARLERLETSSQFAQIVALNETIAIITLSVVMGRNEGLINLCIPYIALEPIIKKLNTRMIFESGIGVEKSEQASELIIEKLNKTPLEVKAVFKDTSAALRDILSLQVGDVIQLNHHIRDELIIKVGHLPKFNGALGSKDNRYAVKITGFIREEEEENE